MPNSAILHKMLDRLHASLMRGPSLNCRPHSSRQRVDLCSFEALGDVEPSGIIPALLSDERRCEMDATIAMPDEIAAMDFRVRDREVEGEDVSAGVKAWRKQKAVLTKLRNLSEDARVYEQDTGVSALHVGYPILSLPPGSATGGGGRVLAPVAFIPANLEVQTGRKAGVKLLCGASGVDLVVPNMALLAWIEKQTGVLPVELIEDEDGVLPWVEIGELIGYVCKAMGMSVEGVERFTDPERFGIEPVPAMEDLKGESVLLRSAVLGLFPSSNQGLIRDTKAMIAAEGLSGPVESFIDAAVSLESGEYEVPDAGVGVDHAARRFEDERLCLAPLLVY